MEIGGFVTHSEHQEWGVGKILRRSDGSMHFDVVFDDETRIVSVSQELLKDAKISDEERKRLTERFWPVIDAMIQGKPCTKPRPQKVGKSSPKPHATPRQFTALVEIFIRKFPGLCNDPTYLNEEYNYKAEASAHFQAVIESGQIKALVEQQRFADAVTLILNALGPNHSNLLYARYETGEYRLLQNGLQDPKIHERFVHAFCNLLGGAPDQQKAFDAYMDILGDIGADVWPTATLPLFFRDNEKHIFVKPQCFRFAASHCGWRIDCSRPPTWSKYVGILEFVAHLKTRLDNETEIVAKNMIDMQSFIYACEKYK